jgi:hypothetical protein
MTAFNIQFFKKPEWLKPEINQSDYWLHLAILSTVALGILELFISKGMFTWQNITTSIPILAIGDLCAHTLLGLD